MSYKVRSGATMLSGLASTTPVALLTTAQLAALNAQFPGWGSAALAGSTFTLYSATAQVAGQLGHTVVLMITTGGPASSLMLTYSVDGGAPVGPVALGSSSQMGQTFAPCLTIPGLPSVGAPAIFLFSGTLATGWQFTFTPTGVVTSPNTATPFAYVGILIPPQPAPLGSVSTLPLTTLADAAPGAPVLLNTGIGEGWTSGVVVSDGTTVNVGGVNYPVATRAVAGLVGYTAAAAMPDSNKYTLAGSSASGNETWFQGNGATFYGGALSTLATTEGLCLIESTPGGAWLARAV